MNDQKKTKEQLIQELEALRRRIADFEKLESRNRQSLDALPDRELTIQTISNNLLSGMIYQVIRKNDGTTVFTYLSDTVRRFYGITPEEGLADSSRIYGQIHEEDRIRFFREEEEANRTLSPFRSEVRMMDPTGGIRWSLFMSHPRRLADGSICWDGIEFDITERKKADKALRESEERFSKIFKTSPDAIAISRTFDGVYLDVNDSFTKVTGYSKKELVGRSPLPGDLALWIDQKDRDPFAAALKETGEVLGLEFRFRHKNGDIHNGLLSARVLDVKGPTCHIAIVTDITEQKRAEEALLKSQKQLQLILNTVPAMIWQKDWEGRYVAVNKAACRILGLAEDDILGKRDHDLFPANIADQSISADRRILDSETPELGIIETHQKPSGKIGWSHVDKLVYYNDEGKVAGTIGYALDITQRKQSEEALKKSKERLRALSAHLESVREEERANISREIHDDLGQLLTGLKMDLSWILRHSNPDQTGLRAKAQAMGQLIDQTVQTVRRISSELRPRILDDFGLVAALEWQAGEFAKKTGITCRFRSSVRQLDLNPALSIAAFRIFQESLTNVVRHSGASRIEALLKRDALGLVLTIRDNGLGISAEEIAQSNSLGLVGMRERALIVGGTVEIKGKKGNGTTVMLRLPVTT